MMRFAWIGLAAFIAVLAADMADMQIAAAQESFFNDRYCTRSGSEHDGGGLDCGYNTWEQCIATARGLGRYCLENPFWHAKPTSRSEPVPRQKVRQHSER